MYPVFFIHPSVNRHLGGTDVFRVVTRSHLSECAESLGVSGTGHKDEKLLDALKDGCGAAGRQRTGRVQKILRRWGRRGVTIEWVEECGKGQEEEERTAPKDQLRKEEVGCCHDDVYNTGRGNGQVWVKRSFQFTQAELLRKLLWFRTKVWESWIQSWRYRGSHSSQRRRHRCG